MAELAIDAAGSFTEQAARRAVTAAAQRVGIDSSAAEIIRLGSNAVFRLSVDTIARVAPSLEDSATADKQIAVARWLVSLGYPVVRAVDVDQPVEADSRVVTFWESIAPETVYAPIDLVAELIRRLHDLSPPPDLDLPKLRPFGRSDDQTPRFDGLNQEDGEFLRRRYRSARAAFDAMTFPLESGVIHGDANVGNVLLDLRGQAVLIDLDSFSIGPREWDLIQTALFADRLGWHTPEEYRTFVEVYGYDITKWDGYEALADMREVAMTAWLAKKAASDEKAAAEVHKRITAMRTGGSRRDWGAY
ncbi:MAG: aminoglycoside phosphotransferase family protein [Pseudonocardiales bacterium]|nr:aminoglycoside phosphotransferase family protein [Pseudonocardiales bacterium]